MAIYREVSTEVFCDICGEKWKADFVGTEKDTPATTWFTAVPEPAPKMTAV